MIKETHCPHDKNIVVRKYIPDPKPEVKEDKPYYDIIETVPIEDIDTTIDVLNTVIIPKKRSK